ncbi:MAG: glutamine-hydrolyzing GMP synthase [Sandaracinaceae bacterium]|nr:glutamine-hydrolyzing GMP synthase [Sandaracinaceae bacterium]
MSRSLVIILDFGSQYTQLIARRIREARVYCEILPCTTPTESLRARSPKAIVLSGGPASVFEPAAPTIDPAIFEMGIPILGICYGMQLFCHVLGGKVCPSARREYGPAKVEIEHGIGVFSPFARGELIEVWMSHGDVVVALPPGFIPLGRSPNTPIAACAHPERKIYGVQFHPEVAHTPRGGEILRAFLFDVAQINPDWTPGVFLREAIERVQKEVGEGHAICALSGGVDSAVAALLVARAIGDRLHCIFVDNGLLRKGEAQEIIRTFREEVSIDESGQRRLNLIHVDASKRFLEALVGVTEPEEKRKIIGQTFIRVFEEEAERLGTQGVRVTHLVQGTLYPDVIESRSFRGPSATIKSHHNVGGLPERMHLGLVEPLRELFKDEVREVGLALGLPKHLLHRHPFPGPGLAVRCLGEVTPERLEILREADAILMEEIHKSTSGGISLYDELWQAFAVLLPVRSVGVMGDARTYEWVCAIRAVHSSDGMTADWARLPYELLERVSSRIINEVRGINRVVYDISSKPPATIEWE